jgi:nucleoside-diphosphate-sugar epimerase
MNVLVTGSAGFIASKVCEFLLAEGHTVVGIDNINDAYDVRLKEWRLAQLKGKSGFEFHSLDICNRPALRDLFEQNRLNQRNKPEQLNELNQPFDAVINLAARAGVRQSVENPWVYYETNVTGTLNLLELCKEFEVKKFVLASTSSLYGQPNQRKELNRLDQPNRLNKPNKRNRPDKPNEPDQPDRPNKLNKPFSESDPTDGPLSPYAASKKAAEALCYTYHYLHDIDMTVLRYFTVYGPAGRPDMSLFRFVQWISEGREVTVFGDGKQSRDFTYVEDIARGTVAGLKPLGYEIINLGSDKPIILNNAIQLVEKLVNQKAKVHSVPRHPADVLATWADISKAKRLLKWRPRTPFKNGLSRLVDWYNENREWASQISTQ